MKLEVFNGKQIQMGITLCNEMIAGDIRTILEMKAVLQTQLDTLLDRVDHQRKKEKKSIQKSICPECGKAAMIPTPNPDGLHIFTCPKCRYSRIIADPIKK